MPHPLSTDCPLPAASRPLADLGLDAFETALLPLLRHFAASPRAPGSQAWHLAYQTAAERWGESFGLPLAHALAALVGRADALIGGLTCHDALEPATRQRVTADEAAFLRMLHHMRRDRTPAARQAVAELAQGRMDAGLIRCGLSLARRFPAGIEAPAAPSRPCLRIAV
ncbi:hypothetical protein [Cribrihabitans neustonicus]|uniref:hypothetical protein n=1 Tax=Cribrihabitans neustonicus TaxID=1429085 RepID=UPI003B5B7543